MSCKAELCDCMQCSVQQWSGEVAERGEGGSYGDQWVIQHLFCRFWSGWFLIPKGGSYTVDPRRVLCASHVLPVVFYGVIYGKTTTPPGTRPLGIF